MLLGEAEAGEPVDTYPLSPEQIEAAAAFAG